MLQNAHLLAKICADTAENERKFAEILPKTGNYVATDEAASASLNISNLAEKMPQLSQQFKK